VEKSTVLADEDMTL